MMLSGIVDFQSEVSSLEKKLAQAEAFKAKLMKKRDNKYYAERVPIEVQEKESEKISEKDAEIAEISKTIEMFKKLSA